MKRILKMIAALAVALVFLMAPLAVLAEGTAEGEEGGLYTWAYLGTNAGAMAATLMIVQLIKAPLDKVWKIPTRLVVYVVALVIMILSSAFTTGLAWEGVILTALNAAVVALAAIGAYESMFKMEGS